MFKYHYKNIAITILSIISRVHNTIRYLAKKSDIRPPPKNQISDITPAKKNQISDIKVPPSPPPPQIKYQISHPPPPQIKYQISRYPRPPPNQISDITPPPPNQISDIKVPPSPPEVTYCIGLFTSVPVL